MDIGGKGIGYVLIYMLFYTITCQQLVMKMAFVGVAAP
jgi:hypothetical protein